MSAQKWNREERLQVLRQRLSNTGHRITPQRLCILEALVESNRHPTAEDIFARVRKVSPTTSLATVYKTIETLKEMGEVQEMEFGDGRNHYDGVDPVPHPHVVCTACGKIEDVLITGVHTLQTQAGQASGFKITSQRLDFYGLCGQCLQISV
jgi:Fur family peroxide stress response transcriptional regulator